MEGGLLLLQLGATRQLPAHPGDPLEKKHQESKQRTGPDGFPIDFTRGKPTEKIARLRSLDYIMLQTS